MHALFLTRSSDIGSPVDFGWIVALPTAKSLVVGNPEVTTR
jgi:hypothetical protein